MPRSYVGSAPPLLLARLLCTAYLRLSYDPDLERSMPSPLLRGRQPHVVLAVCRRWPTLSPSDQRYATALQAVGAQVTVAAWNAREDQPEFRKADLVVIRGTWDYHEQVNDYRNWLVNLAAENIRVLNDVGLVSRFLDKKAFAELAGDEVIVPHCRICPADSTAIADVLSEEAWEQAVLKPVNGASGRGVQLVTPGTVGTALAAVITDVGLRDLLVQEFVPEITAGETQFILFDSKVSHAVLKQPLPGEFRTNSVFAPKVHLLVPPPEAKERIEALVRRIAVQPLYARVDVAMRRTIPVLFEFEVNEPGLWLDIAPSSAAATFARATLARLMVL